ncbi:MAG: c-type cytochrome [bacterium]
MFKKNTIASLLGAALLVAAPGVFADGASLTKDKCGACHGNNGNSSDPEVPSIAGFSATTITDMMTSFKDGDRTGEKYKPEGGEETDMNAVAKDLSDSDLEAIAGYISKQTFKKQANKVDAKLAAKGKKIHDKKCEKCHSEGGSAADDDAAILAGQWKPYLMEEFEKLSSGERLMPKKMKKRFKKLKDKQKAALIEYYAAGGQ